MQRPGVGERRADYGSPGLLRAERRGRCPYNRADACRTKEPCIGSLYLCDWRESIYRQARPLLRDKATMFTGIDHAYDADTHFPDLDADPQWEMTKISDEQTYFDLEYVFTIYERIS
ncbi:MAG: hypothetical protein ACLTLQ_02515 [[Clostridium] scindens]